MTHKPIRRLLALLMACTMLLSLLAVSASAEGDDTKKQILRLIPDKTELNVGDTVTITVKISNNSFGFTNFELPIEYDTELLRLDSISYTYKSVDADGNETEVPYLSGSYEVNLGKYVDKETSKEYIGFITFGTARPITNPNPKTIFTLTFTVLKCATGSVPVSVHNVLFAKVENSIEYRTEPEITPATLSVAHTLTRYSANAPTCTEAGNSEYYVCSGCEKWFSDADGKNEIANHSSVVIAATGHTAGETWQHDDTNHWHICETCNEPVDKAAHSGGTATCTEKAVCVVCNKAYGSTLAHNYVEKYDENQHWKECSVCGAIDPAHPKTDHTFGAWEIVRDSTCTATGTKQRKCNDCAYVEQATIETKAHTLVYHAAQAATCEAAGNIEYWECSVCGAKFSDAAGTQATTDASCLVGSEMCIRDRNMSAPGTAVTRRRRRLWPLLL